MLNTKVQQLELASFLALLPKRQVTAHKGDFGHVLVIGGHCGMAGAVRMAAEAAARTGAGLVTVATRPEHMLAIQAARPELLCFGIRYAWQLKPLLARCTVIVIGPGLGLSGWSRGLLKLALITDKPKVVDADALNLLAKNPLAREEWILTPHPAEAARLLRVKLTEIQAQRLQAVNALQQQYKGVAVLKGAGSLIAGEHARYLCTAGNPGMASGGMGDILSGILGGLLAQGLTLEQAACLGVMLHARAGDAVAAKHGERGMLALDLLPELITLLNSTA